MSLCSWDNYAPKCVQNLSKVARSLSAEALGMNELETLSREKAYLAATIGVTVEVRSADDAGEDRKGKSSLAEPGRPAIWIECSILYWPGLFFINNAIYLYKSERENYILRQTDI